MINHTNEEKNYTVYMHTSPSGKRYIGITAMNPPEKRWLNGRGYKQNPHFYNAIQYYGWSNFAHEILHIDLTKKEAEEKEIELIAFYKSNNREFGYNIANGGSSCGCFTEETKRKMSDIHKTIDKYWVRIPVCQYTTDGVFLKKWKSSVHAEDELGIDASAIRLCCKGEVKISGGYIWKDENDELTEEEVIWRNTSNRYSPNKKEICQYDKNGNFIKKYSNILLASRETNIDHSMIARCCKNAQKTAGGYIWRYSNEELTIDHLRWCNEKGDKLTLRRSVLQCSKDGSLIKKYDSITIASLETGISKCNISTCCGGNGKQKTAGGYMWRYADEE